MCDFEDEYYLLYPYDIENYPLIYEDCHRVTCSRANYKKCEKVPDCPAYYRKTEKIENPQPFILDFYTVFTKKPVIYADCYMALSLIRSSFVVSPKLYGILRDMDIYGIQFIPVTLLEDNVVKYADFIYAHTYNFLPVLSVKDSRFQTYHGMVSRNNLLKIRFNNKKLGKIILGNRLIFRFPLERSYFIFHVSLVEKIMSVKPIGFRFIKISDIDYPNTDGIFI
jgi:hypothetical protein